MRRTAAVAAGVVVMSVLVGCSDDTPDDTSTPAAPTVAMDRFVPVDVPDAVQGREPFTDSATLAGRMITIADLPPGYTGYELPPLDESSADVDAPDRSSTDPAACAAVLAPVASQLPGSLVTASVTYSGPDFASVDQDAAGYSGNGAADAFRTIQDSVADCATFTGTDADGITVDYEVGASPLFPSDVTLGDASFAVRVAVESEGISLTTDAVVTLVGSTVSQLVATGTQPVDPEVVRGLAETAAQRLAS